MISVYLTHVKDQCPTLQKPIGLQDKSSDWFLFVWKYAFKWVTLFPQPKYDKKLTTKMFSHYFAIPQQMLRQPSTRCVSAYMFVLILPPLLFPYKG